MNEQKEVTRALAVAEKADEMQRVNPNWRRGQAMFNALHTLDPVLADHLRGTSADPFHRDERIGAFLTAVRTGLPATTQTGEGVETGADEVAPGQDTGSAWVTRSADCPEAPAQVHPLAEQQGSDESGEGLESLAEAVWNAMPARHTGWRGLTNEDRDLYRGIAARLRDGYLADRLSAVQAESHSETPTRKHSKEDLSSSAEQQGSGWPACATYPNLGCVCRGALKAQANKSTCTRKRTGDLTPIKTLAELQAAATSPAPTANGAS